MSGRPYRLDEPGERFVDELASLWQRVARAGGAVGFYPDAELAEVRMAAAEVMARQANGEVVLIVARHDDRLAGVVWLEPGTGLVAHRALLKALMVEPELQGRGIGSRLLDACLEQATELGVEQLYLSARDGAGLPEYYTRRGWTEVGRFPGGVRVAPGDDRDEVWFLHRL